MAVGYGTVPITISVKGISKEIKGQLSGPLEGAARSSGSKMGDILKGTLKTAGVAAGALLATSLAKGFQRYTAIEDAQAKLKGLGNSAQDVSVIMDNALASVKGTAFGLDAAATTAAGAIAAGIKPGAELEGVLKSVANSAAAAGMNMDEMGAIYTKVASVGKAQNDTLRQVADRGIPIYESLAKQLGVTTAEVEKMASSGKIGFKEFEAAMTEAGGTVADELGQTTTGTIKNFYAALGRLGETMISGVMPHLKTGIQLATGWIDTLTEKIEPVAAWIGKTLGSALESVVGWLSKLDFSGFSSFFDSLGGSGTGDALSSIGDSLSRLGPALAAFGSAIPEIGASLVTLAAGGLKVVAAGLGFLADHVDVIVAMMPAIIAGYAAWRVATAALAFSQTKLMMAQALMAPVFLASNVARFMAVRGEERLALATAGTAAATSASTGVTVANTGATTANNAAQSGGIIARGRAVVAMVAHRIAMVGTTAATWAATAATRAFGVAMAIATAPVTLIVAGIAAVVAGLVLFFTKTETGRKIWAGFIDALKAAWSWIKDVFAAVWDVVSEKFLQAWDTIKSAFSTAIDFISEHWKTLLTIFGGPLGAAIAGIATHWDTIKNAAGTAVDWIKGKWDEFSTGLGQFYDTWIQPIVDGFETVQTVIERLAAGIGALFSDNEGVQNAGGGLIKGILGEGAGQAVIDTVTWIKDAFTAAKDGIGIAIDWISVKWQEFTAGFGEFYATWIQPVIDAFTWAWANLSTGVGIAIDWISQKWAEFSTAFGEFWNTWISPILTTMQSVWSAVSTAIGTVITTVVIPAWNAFASVISAVWSGVISVVWSAIQTGAQVMGTVLSGAWNVIKAGFQAVGTVISSVWNNIVRPVFDLFRNVAGVVADFLTGNFGNIGNRFREMGNTIRSIFQGVIRVALDAMRAAVGFAGNAWNSFKETVGNVVNIVRSKVSEMVDTIKTIPNRIRGFFADAGSWLINAGKNVINGFIQGIESMFSSVTSAIGNITSLIPGFGEGAIVMVQGGVIAPSYVQGGIEQLEQYANGGSKALHRVDRRRLPQGFLPSQATIKRPQGARGLVQWAESETAGEAFIPLAESKRTRSTAILGKVADLFGMALVDKVSGLPIENGYSKSLGPVQAAAFAEGGVTGQRLLDFVWGKAGKMTRPLEGSPYVWGGGRGPSDWGDCSGAQSIIAGFLAGRWNTQNPVRLMFTGNQGQVLKQLGYTIGRPPGNFVGHATGWKNGGPAGGHTAGTIFTGAQKVNVEMGGGRGNGQIGGGAAGWNDSYFNQFAYKAAGASIKSVAGQMLDATGAIKAGADVGGDSSSTTSSKPSTPSFGAADELYKQAAAYLGVIEDQTVQISQQVKTAGDQEGSNWNAIPLDKQNLTAPRPGDWGPAFFNYEIARQAKAKNLPIRGAMIGIGTTLVESGDPQKMYANRSVPASLGLRHDAIGSDHDSVGLFQQRQAGWGTLAQRMSPFESAGLFFSAMLRKFPNWQSMAPGAVAQGVQVSAFPGRYAGKMAKALSLAQQTRLYDTGGILPHGGAAVNLSGKPEAIWTNAQWAQFAELVVGVAQLVDPMRVMARDTRDTSIAVKQLAGDYAAETARNARLGAASIGKAAYDAVPPVVWEKIAWAQGEANKAARHWQTVSKALETKAIAWAHGEWPIGSGRTWTSTAPNPQWQAYSLDESLQAVTAANVEIARKIARGEQKAGNDPLARAIYDVFGRTPITHTLGKIYAAGPDGWQDATRAVVKAFETGDRRDLYKWADEYSQLMHAVLTVREAVMASGQWVAHNITIPLEKFVAEVEATRKYVERLATDVGSIVSQGFPAINNSLGLLTDIAVTGNYADNPYFKADSPLVDAAMAVNDFSNQIKDTFDDMSKQSFEFGKNFGGEWLAQAEIVRDAEKGLAELRKQQVDEVYDYSQVNKQNREAHEALRAAGGVGNPEVRDRMLRLDTELNAKRRSDDIEELTEVHERYVRTMNELIRVNATLGDSEDIKKRGAALEQVRDAETAATNMRLNQLNVTKKLEAAERAVAAARYTAFGDLMKQLGDAVKTPIDSAVKWIDQMGKAAGVVAKLRQEVARLRMEQINLSIKSTQAALDLRVAEMDVATTRAENAISIAKAEAELAAAQRGHLTMGASSVDALAAAVDRFRVSGVDAIDDILLTWVANTAEVQEKEYALKLARAEAHMEEQQAAFNQLKATYTLQQATALQVYTAEMQQVVSQQLAAQTQAVMGMSQQAANGFGRFASGASQGATGLFGLLGNIAGGLASFATGNIAGVVSNVVGGIGNLGGLILGGNKMIQNKDEAAEAFSQMDGATKLGLGLSLLGGGAAAGLGAAASFTMGPEMLGYGAQIGGALIGTAFDTAAGTLADNMEAVNGRYEDILAKMKLDFDLDKSMGDANFAAAQAKWEAEKLALEAEIAKYKLGVEKSKYEQSDDADANVIAAYEAAMGVADQRTQELIAATQSSSAQIEAAVAALAKKQPVNITVEAGTYDERAVVDLLEQIFDRVEGVEAQVAAGERTTVGAADYLASRLK